MRIFVLSQEAIRKEKRNGLIRGVITGIIALAIGAGIPVSAGLVSGWILIIMIPLLAIMFSFSFRRALKMLEENKASYQLLVRPDGLVRKQLRIPDLEIHSDQITKIEYRKGVGILIWLSDNKSSIQIPEGLEGFDEFREHISAWKPIDSAVPKMPYAMLFQTVAIVSFICAFAAMWLSGNLIVVAMAGAFVIVYMLVSLIHLRRREDIDPRLKFSRWRIAFLMLALSLMLYSRIYALLAK